ncbi:hypothetical protein RSAG8_13979, partial [Rhizoctonia solani AG-8 WAC10335]
MLQASDQDTKLEAAVENRITNTQVGSSHKTRMSCQPATTTLGCPGPLLSTFHMRPTVLYTNSSPPFDHAVVFEPNQPPVSVDTVTAD